MASHGWTTWYPAAACLAALLVGFGSTSAGAQEQAARDSVLAAFSLDIAELQRHVEATAAYTRFGTTDALGTMPMFAPDSATVLKPETPIHAAPSEEARVIGRLEQGTRVRFLSFEEAWYEVLTTGDGEVVGWIPADAARLEFPHPARLGAMGRGGLWAIVVERAREIRDKYANNPYLRVTGFDVELGLPPSVTVGFEFK